LVPVSVVRSSWPRRLFWAGALGVPLLTLLSMGLTLAFGNRSVKSSSSQSVTKGPANGLSQSTKEGLANDLLEPSKEVAPRPKGLEPLVFASEEAFVAQVARDTGQNVWGECTNKYRGRSIDITFHGTMARANGTLMITSRVVFPEQICFSFRVLASEEHKLKLGPPGSPYPTKFRLRGVPENSCTLPLGTLAVLFGDCEVLGAWNY
jgi:hypothetical protein